MGRYAALVGAFLAFGFGLFAAGLFLCFSPLVRVQKGLNQTLFNAGTSLPFFL